MKIYGLRKRDLDLITNIIERAFSRKQFPQVYLFGSRATGKHRPNSDIDIALKDGKNIDDRIPLIQEQLEESDLPFKVDLLNWNNILPEYKDSINRDKKLIWSPELKEKSSEWRPCPLGEHWVRRHNKVAKTGKVGDWDGHCRKNPSGKDVLKGDEMDFIAETWPFRNAKLKCGTTDLGFKNGNSYNHLIEGWTAYWNSILEAKDPLHPNLVKALIASESRFVPNAIAKNKGKVGPARGLVQVTEQTRQILKDRKGELKDHFVDLKKSDLGDPNKNISASIRWLFRKRETAKNRLKKEPTWEEVIFEYKGILKQKNKKAQEIKTTFKKYLKELNA